MKKKTERVECDWKANGVWTQLNHVARHEGIGTMPDAKTGNIIVFGWHEHEGPKVWRVDKQYTTDKGIFRNVSTEPEHRKEIHNLRSGTYQFETEYLGNLVEIRLRWKK